MTVRDMLVLTMMNVEGIKMEYYETEDDYTGSQIKEFNKWFDDEIGTDYELNESASGLPDEFYTLFCDLEGDEVDKVRAKELELRAKWNKD